ncbi:hypothetical protein [Chryseobacterium sp. SG20098]|uniref:hypothetical protein n=1 Tax=Chryseobacterium sp. SG20098 TaxID=3074145 RepID=UPI0028830C63|nr:hypothetical protein [Chryseobacterium sp. SG20098]WNI35974.1 hypothetical protein RHP76_18630 [Chryseobacterium sp. SG20098]
MAQQKFKIIKCNSDEHDPSEFAFFAYNEETSRTCTKHKTKEIYFIRTMVGTYALYVYNKEEAMRILNSQEPVDLNGILETASQEEVEKVTPENIDQKSVEFLERFNKNFKFNVTYTPDEKEMDFIDERIRKTVWNKENVFLLNFYLMEATKRKFNFNWTFQKILTFNPFYVPEYVDRMGIGSSYYSFLKPSAKNYFSIKWAFGIISTKEMMDNNTKP